MNKFHILTILTILFSIYSCTPQQKLNRLIKNHPELAETTVKEKTITITEIDTIFIPKHQFDTTVRISDTVSIEDSIVFVQIIKNDTVYKIRTIVKPRNIITHDTLVYTYKDTVNTFTYKPLTFKEKSKYRGQGMGIMLLIILLIIIIYQGIRLYLKGQFPFLNILNKLK